MNFAFPESKYKTYTQMYIDLGPKIKIQPCISLVPSHMHSLETLLQSSFDIGKYLKLGCNFAVVDNNIKITD